jgi:hypothetical protein
MSNHLLSGMIFKNYKVNDTNDTNVKVNVTNDMNVKVKVKVSQEKTGPVILISLIF